MAKEASPRISFSQGIQTANETQRSDNSLPTEPFASDFNFSIGSQISADHASNADELFSNGKILPFFKNPISTESKSANPIRPPILDRRSSLRELIDSSTGSTDSTTRRSFWRFGRSSSVGSVADRGPILLFPLNRCKSTGSFPNPARRQQRIAGAVIGSLKMRSDSNPRKIYYFSGSQRGSQGGGVRINPILNVPAPIITNGGGSGGSNGAITGIFAYLLCNCGGEAKRDEIGDLFMGSRRNGTGSV